MIDINKKYRYAGDGYGTPRILCIDRKTEDGNFPVVSMDIYGGFYCHQENGVCRYDRKFDLIEAKEKKNIVRMAPALVYIGGYYRLTDSLFANDVEPYHQYPNTFIKWLIDTHAVDVEVDDD